MCLPPVRSRFFLKQDSEDDETGVDVNLSLDPALGDHGGFQPYVPEDFANFEIYNATLESQEGPALWRSDSKRGRCGGGSAEREVPRSPTVSSCTSGYFSHSASNATLSDMPFSASESSDHLSCAPRDPGDALGCAHAKSASLQQAAPSACGAQTQPTSSPIRIPHCTETQQALALSGSQEFTDFKGADESIGEAGLSPFTEGWKQRGVEFSIDPQRTADSVETCDNQHLDLPVLSAVCKCPNNADAPTATQLSDKAPSTPSTATPSAALRSSVPTPRAGGEPPVQEPAQGDLPHGSPCPSPSPSSAEPSGDSSGDESTPAAQLPDWMAPGEQVWVGKRRGTVYYVGGVEFAKGIWIGVKLDLAVGESKICETCNIYIRHVYKIHYFPDDQESMAISLMCDVHGFLRREAQRDCPGPGVLPLPARPRRVCEAVSPHQGTSLRGGRTAHADPIGLRGGPRAVLGSSQPQAPRVSAPLHFLLFPSTYLTCAFPVITVH